MGWRKKILLLILSTRPKGRGIFFLCEVFRWERILFEDFFVLSQTICGRLFFYMGSMPAGSVCLLWC